MNKFKVGDLVSWKSQSYGSITKKEGVICAVVPADSQPYDIISVTKKMSEFNRMFDGNPRPILSYLVEVPSKSGRGRTKLYWPRAEKLEGVLNKEEVKMMNISSRFSFDAAHFLPSYEGKCSSLHGHHWVVEVEIMGKVDPSTGMILDFHVLKKIVEEEVIEILDHTHLNRIIQNPTAENIVLWIWEKLKGKLPLFLINLWETPDNKVVFFCSAKEPSQ